MNQNDKKLIKTMNLKSDAIVINQGKKIGYEVVEYESGRVRWFDMQEFGIGLSRNHALLRSKGDIVLFADDDVVYNDQYVEDIIEEFEKNQKADIIIFNLESTNENRAEYMNQKHKRIHFYNCLKYGTFRIAARTSVMHKRIISFSTLFGGGSRYGSGEDSLFLIECLKKGLKVYASPKTIGNVKHQESTWFCGYSEKYWKDKGALFACMSKKFAKILCFQMCLRHKEMRGEMSVLQVYKIMKMGVEEFCKNEVG